MRIGPPSRVLAAALGMLVGGWLPVDHLEAQASAANLVVRVEVPDVDVGAGIILHDFGDSLLIATARHVLAAAGGERPGTPFVQLGPGQSLIEARLVRHTVSLDLALLVVPVPPRTVGRTLAFDWLGEASKLAAQDPVAAVGCPRGSCFGDPSEGRLARPPGGSPFLAVQSNQIVGGNSGGALLDRDGEIVGMVTQVGREGSRVMSRVLLIEEVLRYATCPPEDGAEAWGELPVGQRVCADILDLHVSQYPRGGYRSSVGITQFFPTPSSVFERAPSFRASWVEHSRGWFSWHAGLFRLGTDDLGMWSVSGGFGALVPKLPTRIQIRPFVEVGAGIVRTRFDEGGYVDARPAYVPAYTTLEETTVGAGVGATLSLMLPRDLIVEVTLGRWSFDTPPLPDGLEPAPIGRSVQAPTLDRAFFGVGLRYGRRW